MNCLEMGVTIRWPVEQVMTTWMAEWEMILVPARLEKEIQQSTAKPSFRFHECLEYPGVGRADRHSSEMNKENVRYH